MDAEQKRVKFRRGLDCFNRREFFVCHEVLEEIWLEETEEEKPFYQGIIQVAAAFHHYLNGNLPGTLYPRPRPPPPQPPHRPPPPAHNPEPRLAPASRLDDEFAFHRAMAPA